MSLEDLRSKLLDVEETLSKYIVGHKWLLRLMVVALASGGHILIEGPPGVGKTTAARLFAQLIGGKFRRIQATSDTLPSDILGSYYYDIARGSWVLREGPIFANIVFIDELNRAPPRTYSALLEAMQEGRVTIEGVTYSLPRPFLLIATQIPVTAAGEGTYPLPLLIRDRFAYSYRAGMPTIDEEVEVLGRVDVIDEATLSPIMSQGDIEAIQGAVRKHVYVSDRVKRYIVELVDRIRRSEELAASPSTRASIWIMRGSRVLAFLEGLDYVAPDHVKAIAPSVLSHRIALKPEYEVEGLNPVDIVRRALEEVEVPKS